MEENSGHLAILSKRLKLMRERRGFSQAELAKHLNMSQSTVAKIETGNREPNIETLCFLAGLFACSTDYLLGINQDPAPIRIDSMDLRDILDNPNITYEGIPLSGAERETLHITIPTFIMLRRGRKQDVLKRLFESEKNHE